VSLLRTTDGGRHFIRLPAPPLPAGSGLIRQLWFADRRNGFASSGGDFSYATHDGGRTWHRLRVGTLVDLATAVGRAYAVTAACGRDACTAYRFQSTVVSVDDWRPVPWGSRRSRWRRAAQTSWSSALSDPKRDSRGRETEAERSPPEARRAIPRSAGRLLRRPRASCGRPARPDSRPSNGGRRTAASASSRCGSPAAAPTRCGSERHPLTLRWLLVTLRAAGRSERRTAARRGGSCVRPDPPSTGFGSASRTPASDRRSSRLVRPDRSPCGGRPTAVRPGSASP